MSKKQMESMIRTIAVEYGHESEQMQKFLDVCRAFINRTVDARTVWATFNEYFA